MQYHSFNASGNALHPIDEDLRTVPLINEHRVLGGRADDILPILHVFYSMELLVHAIRPGVEFALGVHSLPQIVYGYRPVKAARQHIYVLRIKQETRYGV